MEVVMWLYIMQSSLVVILVVLLYMVVTRRRREEKKIIQMLKGGGRWTIDELESLTYGLDIRPFQRHHFDEAMRHLHRKGVIHLWSNEGREFYYIDEQ